TEVVARGARVDAGALGAAVIGSARVGARAAHGGGLRDHVLDGRDVARGPLAHGGAHAEHAEAGRAGRGRFRARGVPRGAGREGGAVRALARALPLELGAEPRAGLRAELRGARARDARERRLLRIVRVREAIDGEAA